MEWLADHIPEIVKGGHSILKKWIWFYKLNSINLLQFQLLNNVNAIIVVKKNPYSKKKTSGNAGKKGASPATKSGTKHGAAVYGGSAKDKTIALELKEPDSQLIMAVPFFHFLPELEKESPTYKYDQIKPLLDFLGYNQGDSSELLETNASTLSRWKNSDKPVDIGKLRSKIVLDIDEIISKGVRIFGDERLFQDWLNTSNYSLGDVKPVDLLKDVYSIELVEDAIDALSWGSYV